MILRRSFITLEAVQFQSVRFEELQAREQPLKDLVFVILLQRLLCSGVIPLPKSRAGETISVEDIEINAVLADIRNRIKQDPSFQKHRFVQNIFVQLTTNEMCFGLTSGPPLNAFSTASRRTT
jgi:hypothetical protein